LKSLTIPSPLKSPPFRRTCRRGFFGFPSVSGQAGLESLGEPHVKHLEGKLWELRLTGRDGIARALYVTAIGRRVVVVRAFVKKTQRTPRAEIELALRRAKEIT
jgi:phage-related protein